MNSLRYPLTLVGILLLTIPAHANHDKLDLMLHGIADAAPESKALLGKAIATRAQGQLIDVLVQSKDSELTVAAVEEAGGEVRTIAGDILVVAIPPSFLASLSQHDEVVFIEASKPMTIKMDTARSHTNVAPAQAGTTTGTALKGADVVIGVVDDGLAYDHADFLGGDSKTRVQFIRQRATDGKFTICVKSQIDAGSCSIQKGGQGTFHGTHVTSIAAGSHATYTGVAPDADIFFIFNSATDADSGGSTSSLTTFSGAVIEAVDEIFKGADQLDKPAVVNLSLGTSIGAHDDTSLLEKGLNNLVGKAGRIIVNAAGNENLNTALASNAGAGGIHADVNVAAGVSTGWRFVIRGASISNFGFALADIWLANGDKDRCTIESRGYLANASSATTNSRVTVGPNSLGSDVTGTSNTNNDGTAKLSLGVDDSDVNNNRPHAQVLIERASTNVQFSSILSDGSTTGYVFDLIIRATGGSCTGSIWLYPDQTSIIVFLGNVAGNGITGNNSYTLANGDSNKTMTIPGTASGVITAGSFMQEKPVGSGASRWTDIDGTARNQTSTTEGTGGTVSAVSLFSSLGPTGEASGSRTKPDVIAPGEPILAALASGAASTTARSSMADSTHFKLEGTSMSSPHVAGLIALVLQKNNSLTASQMKALLTSTATAVAGASANAAGSGRVNLTAALNGTTTSTSTYKGTRDVATSDVGSEGFTSGSSTTSGSGSSGGGCALVGSDAARSTLLGIALLVLPVAMALRKRRRA